MNIHKPFIRSPIKLCTGRLSPRPPGAFSISLHRADLAQPGIPDKVETKIIRWNKLIRIINEMIEILEKAQKESKLLVWYRKHHA